MSGWGPVPVVAGRPAPWSAGQGALGSPGLAYRAPLGTSAVIATRT
jgi:hypothetical protein